MQRSFLFILSVSTFVGCQDYEFVFQPDSQREGQTLRFAVEQPSKADLLFVVDNSVSMTDEQTALGNSINVLLDVLAPQDTSYRIGLVSTDTQGQYENCAGTLFVNETPSLPIDTLQYLPFGLGNCGRESGPDPVQIKRPHDGVNGRLMAAFDPREFDVAEIDALSTQKMREAFTAIAPTSAYAGPAGLNGDVGARTVIDREIIQAEACVACDCVGAAPTSEDIQNSCSKGASCFETCASPVATALVTAYFRSNLNGFGIRGSGYEAGLRSGMLAVGIEPRDATDVGAITPADDLTQPGKPNTFMERDDTGQVTERSWTRHEALLGIMYLSDEQDCSVPAYLSEADLRHLYEEGGGQPTGSICYQPDLATQFLDTQRLSDLIALKKTSAGRVALGFIGGAQQVTVGAQRPDANAVPADCIRVPNEADPSTQPSTNCACLNMGVATDVRWCSFTLNQDDNFVLPTCDAMAGSRYIDFINHFPRRAFDSVCKNDYSAALTRFANIAVEACFDLDANTRPYNDDAANILVKLAPKLEADAGDEPEVLPMVAQGSVEEGWYYQSAAAGSGASQICLNNRDRLLGDVYEIFVLTNDYVDYTK